MINGKGVCDWSYDSFLGCFSFWLLATVVAFEPPQTRRALVYGGSGEVFFSKILKFSHEPSILMNIVTGGAPWSASVHVL